VDAATCGINRPRRPRPEVGPAMKNRTHFTHRIDIWDDTGENIIEHNCGCRRLSGGGHWQPISPRASTGRALPLPAVGRSVIEDSRRTRLV
jgi:hypothetical protein